MEFEVLIQALADPEDTRSPAELESELGLEAGRIAALIRDEAAFRDRLNQALVGNRDLARLCVLKSIAAKAREGSFQHQKYLLESLEEEGGQSAGPLTVEFVVRDVDA